jgi:SpoVK/Ycf46/Vps4 family AAA+-type ATPase
MVDRVGIPSAKDRLDILQTLLSSTTHILSPDSIESIAFSTHGYVGADLAALVREAGLKALKRAVMRSEGQIGRVVIEEKDLKSALTMIKPSAMREVYSCLCNVTRLVYQF